MSRVFAPWPALWVVSVLSLNSVVFCSAQFGMWPGANDGVYPHRYSTARATKPHAKFGATVLPVLFERASKDAGAFSVAGRNQVVRINSHRIELLQTTDKPGPPGSNDELSRVVMEFFNASPAAQPFVTGKRHTPAVRFRGTERMPVELFERIGYKSIYPGVDIVYYYSSSGLEYDLTLAPGSDPNSLILSVKCADQVEITAAGDLRLVKAGREWTQRKPVVYQFDSQGRPHLISANYLKKSSTEIGFNVGIYDKTRPLIIDPAIVATVRLGGKNEDFIRGLAIDRQNNVYLVGRTLSGDFPTTPGSQATDYHPPFSDAFVTKLEGGTGRIIYSAYLGGDFEDQAAAVAVDAEGHAYVAGFTASTNFPSTPGAFQTSLSGGRAGDVFLTKLSPDGASLVYATYLGGSRSELVTAIALDPEGHAYLTGQTASFDFPTTPNSFQPVFAGINFNSSDAFVTKFNRTGSGLEFSTFLGSGTEQGLAIAVDRQGFIYVAGITSSPNFPATPGVVQTTLAGASDAFLAKFNPVGNALIFATYLGGENQDFATGLALDPAGNCYISGLTSSPNFPVANAFQATYGGQGPQQAGDGFVAKLNSAASAIAYASFLGGTGDDLASTIAVDQAGNAWLGGLTTSTNFPVFKPTQPAYEGLADGFLIKVAPEGRAIEFATYLGGEGDDKVQAIALAAGGVVFVAGETTSTNFPAATKFAGTGSLLDVFLLQFSSAARLQIAQASATTIRGLLLAEAGNQYAIESSTNLLQWLPLATNGPGPGAFEFTDTLDLQYRFYRARLLP